MIGDVRMVERKCINNGKEMTKKMLGVFWNQTDVVIS